MQKIKAKALTSILLMAMIMAVLPLTVNASTGYIRINVVAPASSPLGFTVPAGGNVNLHFGGVTWSGGQFYLLLSTNGFSDMTGDVYSATFDLVNLTDPVGVSTYPGPTGSGMSWKVGNNWVNGSIPLNIAGGAYYIKAFDGLSTSVAVTDTSITVVGTMTVKPTSGPGGAALLLRGFAFAANSLVNLTYYNTTSPFNKITIANLVPADALGQFNYSMTAPDLKLIVTPAGDSAFVPTPIIFNAKYSAGDGYNVTYNENPRGLKRINTSTATNLYGNATDIPVSKQVGETVRLIGLNFYPGTANILWDGATSIATATVNSTGGFDTVITVPTAGVGAHWVAIQDAGVSFFLVINVTPTLTLTPSSGPVGITVTAAGIGFPGSVGTNVYNITVAWTPYSGSVYAIAWGLTDASGQFTTTFVVPHEAGGNRTVTATANVTGTTASKIFYVTPTLVVSPSSFTNNGAVVNVYGSGLDPTGSYTPNIDNRYVGVDPYPSDYPTSIVANGTGDINLQFVAAGFTSGTHVFSLYKGGEILMPASNYVLFNVTGDNTQVLLTSINNTITGLSGLTGNSSSLLMSMDQKLSAINATVVAINGNMVTLATSVGTISTDLSAIKPQITSISSGVDTVKGAVATVQTSIGTLQTSLSSISGTLSSVSGTMGTISTSVGTITSSLSSIGTTVTSIKDGVATIQTDLGTLQGTVTATDGKVATIQTSIGTLQADVADVQTSVDAVPGAVNLPIWIAVILALVAAIASILCLVLMRRKIAG